MSEVRALRILLGEVPVGHLTAYPDGRNIFSFDGSYVDLGSSRPVLGLNFNRLKDLPGTARALAADHKTRARLPPFFSNLLPEGLLREFMIKRLKIHRDHEFDLLAALGESLPGSVRALTADVPLQAAARGRVRRGALEKVDVPIKFSLGGSQLKFSMVEQGGRFVLDDGAEEWIVKPPHPVHAGLPQNELTMMRLAEAAGVDVPPTKLVRLADLELDGLTGFAIPRHEPWAYAIQRYDRTVAGRVHVEDFAQVFDVYPEDEYRATNYDTMARLIYEGFPNRHEQLAEFVRRLVVNILIGNGDAHLKNWSVIYRDGRTAQLAPAYDLVSTIQYVGGDSLALNLGREKRFAAIDASHFDRLARRVGAEPKFVLDVVAETVELARTKWPGVLRSSKLSKEARDALRRHLAGLSALLRIAR